MLTGQNGILNKATEAKEKTEIAQIIEQVRLAIFEKQALNSKGEITGEELRNILNNYFTGVPETLPTDETELKELELISKNGEYSIKVGEIWTGPLSGSTVTPPGGETVEKGKIVTGSNAEWKDDTNEYPAIIPVGFCVVTDAETIEQGLVISDVEGDDMENTKKGNQFVWIPVNDYSKFHLIEGYYNGALDSILSEETNPAREAGDTDAAGSPLAKNNTAGTAESKAMYKSVKDNKGFYIARYEAGIEGTTDNYSLTTKIVADGSVKPLSKKGVGVWNSIP